MSEPEKHMPIGPWAMDGKAFKAFLANADAARAQYGPLPDTDLPTKLVSGQVAVISIVGNLTKFDADAWWDGTSMQSIQRALAEARNDSAVRAILLRICSPGGIAAGVDDVAREVAAIGQTKPVVAFVEDFALSAAYWIASQATRIIAPPSALVGSIGVYIALEDTSAAAEAAGVRVVLVRSGDFKGGSAPGVPLDESELEDTKRYVSELSGLFVDSVARGRKLEPSAALALADGRTFMAAEALRVGLIDEIGSFNQALDGIEKGQSAGASPASAMALATTGAQTMAKENKKPDEPAAEDNKDNKDEKMPAGMAELKEKLPDSSAAFREKCHLAGLTLQQAAAMYEEERDADMETPGSEEEQTGKAPAAENGNKTTVKPAAKAAMTGVAPLEDRPPRPGHAAAASDSAAGQVQELVAQQLTEAQASGRPLTRAAAHAAVMRAHPDLREQYVTEHNEAHPHKRPGQR